MTSKDHVGRWIGWTMNGGRGGQGGSEVLGFFVLFLQVTHFDLYSPACSFFLSPII